MISRRLLRIKVLMSLYAYNRREDDDLARAETELKFSITKTYDLYHYLILLIIEIADVALDKLEQALLKKMPSPEDLNPNRRFIDNEVLTQLRNNVQLRKYLSASKLSWANHRHVPRALYNKLSGWEPYKNYMKAEGTDYQSDKKFIISIISEFLAVSDDLLNCLEEQSIYWNDDMEYVVVMLEKTLKRFKQGPGDNIPLLPLFKNEEDELFPGLLFRKVVMNSGKYSDIINRNTTNWEVERIALMDILVMQLAIAEVLEFPEIPVKVTLNEYIEIAKFYCTSKSSTFVNGILDNIVKEMREKDLFKKYGRGLMGEPGYEKGNTVTE
ncbi:MAG: transcription antitermination factor NusB [Bacteroidales bacterium]|nr:transcription antitermination factor NusB [Bacteroidales bacterium]MBN2633954.1 transcription antitermination factor NusB [Bacteroidales bacterium]